MVAAAVQWAERIMQKIDNVTADTRRLSPEIHPLETNGLTPAHDWRAFADVSR